MKSVCVVDGKTIVCCEMSYNADSRFFLNARSVCSSVSVGE